METVLVLAAMALIGVAVRLALKPHEVEVGPESDHGETGLHLDREVAR